MKMKNSYLPSIDSLRAIAVISVIIYHCSASYLPGGFLGVDLFFVLSGYLISSLLIKEFKDNERVNLANFYLRRARRLLPAVYLMITVILIILVLFNKVLLSKSHLDAVFGYIYVSNWWYIFHEVDYFDSFGAVSPFKHLWSLAIEEQFYMFFPLLFILFNLRNKDRKILNTFKYVVLLLIVISLVLHIFLFDINNINRVYYGTDTRAFSLLVGVLGSLIYPMSNLKRKVSPKINMMYSMIGRIAIVLFIVSMFIINEYSSFLYRGGFLLFSILFLTIIITVGQQHTHISRILSFKPLVYIGKFSYSLYLWHFPILILTTPVSEIGNPNLLLNLLRVILVFVIAYLSYKFVEMPIRYQGFLHYIRNIYNSLKSYNSNKKKQVAFLGVSLTILFIMGLFGKSVPGLSTAFIDIDKKENVTEFKSDNSNIKVDSNTEYKEENKVYNKIIVIGDSLAVDIGNKISGEYPGAVVDGKVSRQVYNSYTVVQQYENLNNSETAVIFLLGTNGLFTEEQLDKLIKSFDKSDIYFVNVKVPRSWEKSVNEVLKNSKDKYNNLSIVDWYTLSKDHPEYFSADKVHLTDAGSTALVELINNNLKYKVETSEMLELKKTEEQNTNNKNNNNGN
ncbi:acyltransferase [Gemella sp. GH3]|uniref:acyltransferase family protein n=1 Tax=unclassified Gemella TaxID=2624949 RepID=UPI0015CF8DA6|nr:MULTISPECIES: acyltransferase family protein [unclassified Gemella]MBF0713992.1 acyltransferase [Gemella sp. GH3.1]NYS50944.1 acyltransferase [Gemella sp. GH3]